MDCSIPTLAINRKMCYNIIMLTRLIYTIGYSGYGNNPDLLIDELKKRKINVIIDVRSNPYSAQFNLFNKEPFEKELLKNGIHYRNYADYFGAKQEDPTFYSRFDGKELRIDYDIFVQSELFKKGANNMITIVEKEFIPAIMCSEKDPINCHRAIMVSRVLFHDYGFEVKHIVPGKQEESQSELEKRIMETVRADLVHKKKLNQLEQKMKDKINPPPMFAAQSSNYINDIFNYYRIINSRIGWTREEVLGYKK